METLAPISESAVLSVVALTMDGTLRVMSSAEFTRRLNCSVAAMVESAFTVVV